MAARVSIVHGSDGFDPDAEFVMIEHSPVEPDVVIVANEPELVATRTAYRKRERNLRRLGMTQIVIAILGVLLCALVLVNIALEIRGILQSAEKARTEGVTDFKYYNARVLDDLVGVLIMSSVAAIFWGIGRLGRGLRRLRPRSRTLSAWIWFVVCLIGFMGPPLMRLSGILIRPFEYANGAATGFISLTVVVFLMMARTKYVTSSEYRSVVAHTPQLGQFKL